MKIDITAVILTSNSSEYVQSAINSVLWCREILIIDDYSKDNIDFIVSKNKIKIFKHSTHKNFSNARNLAIKKAKFDWILFVDSDEFVTEPLRRDIIESIQKNSYSGYFLHRVDFWCGKYMQNTSNKVHKYGENGNTYIVRLGKRNSGRWVGKVHEVWRINGKIGRIDSDLLHFPHKNVLQFVKHVNLYSKSHAMEKNNSKYIFLRILFFPLFKFLYMYFYLKGYKNGIHGFIYAGMMSLHSFLSWTRLWFIKTDKIKYI